MMGRIAEIRGEGEENWVLVTPYITADDDEE